MAQLLTQLWHQDPRNYQILFLSLFLGLGLGTRDWTLNPLAIFSAMATALLTQAVFSQFLARCQSGDRASLPFNWRSPLITALGLSLLLRVDHWATMALATGVAIASKFILKLGPKHFFNPANLGIIVALTLLPGAWVSPGQWGEDLWCGLMFVGAGGIVLKRVGRWDTTLAFLGSYSFLEGARNLWLGWTWDVWFHRLTSGSLLLFALFMVTDPRSIPNAQIGRLLWSGTISLATFILRNYFYSPTAAFWALFLVSPLTLLVDHWWSAQPFSWSDLSPDSASGSASGS